LAGVELGVVLLPEVTEAGVEEDGVAGPDAPLGERAWFTLVGPLESVKVVRRGLPSRR